MAVLPGQDHRRKEVATMPYGTDLRDPIRILYIDDDPALGALVKRALRRRGHEVTHVTNSADGFACLEKGNVDLIALDHTMPGESGMEVLGRLGARGDRPPVVYVTGSADVRVAVEAIKAGADDYIVKDVSDEFFELLTAGIEQVFERWRLRRQRVESDKAVREARDRAELLLQEVNHRLANSLGLVAAMVRMQAATLADPAAVQALQETQARITAIAGVHRHLYLSDRVGHVDIDAYLGHLLTELRNSLSDDDHPYKVTLVGERIEISTDKAVSLGIMVSELVTNAFKYAYQSRQAGEIRVLAKALPDKRVRVVIEDDGAGCDPEAVPRGSGFGSRILAAMAINMGAEVIHHTVPVGTRVTVDFPAC